MKKTCISLFSALLMVLPSVAMAQGETEVRNNLEYVAEITNVKDFNLIGLADLVYWQNFLSREGLVPFNKNGKAEIIVTAQKLSWMGISFKEFVVAVTLGNKQGTSRNGCYLVHAYNTSGLLAFYERVLFYSPYTEAKIDIQDSPVSVDVSVDNTSVFKLNVSNNDYFLGANDEKYLLNIALPKKEDDPKERFFYAQITGLTKNYKYSTERDSFTLNPIKSTPVIKFLRESNFMPVTWAVRNNSSHGKSKTYEK